jgi:hypothetical protein
LFDLKHKKGKSGDFSMVGAKDINNFLGSSKYDSTFSKSKTGSLLARVKDNFKSELESLALKKPSLNVLKKFSSEMDKSGSFKLGKILV